LFEDLDFVIIPETGDISRQGIFESINRHHHAPHPGLSKAQRDWDRYVYSSSSSY